MKSDYNPRRRRWEVLSKRLGEKGIRKQGKFTWEGHRQRSSRTDMAQGLFLFFSDKRVRRWESVQVALQL